MTASTVSATARPQAVTVARMRWLLTRSSPPAVSAASVKLVSASRREGLPKRSGGNRRAAVSAAGQNTSSSSTSVRPVSVRERQVRPKIMASKASNSPSTPMDSDTSGRLRAPGSRAPSSTSRASGFRPGTSAAA